LDDAASEVRAAAKRDFGSISSFVNAPTENGRAVLEAWLARYGDANVTIDGFTESVEISEVAMVTAALARVSSSPSVSAGTSSTGSSGYEITSSTGSSGYEMVSLPGGSFEMGCTAGQSDCDDDEKPTHRVTVSGFSMGATEVTQGLYRSVMGTNPSYYSCDDCPVEEVSWFDAVKFANAMSRQEGLEECYSISGESVSWPKGLSCTGYRLPTEAEWEYAARAGEDTLYAGGDNPDAVAWYGSNMTHAVGGKQANAWGLYDMSGNVREWCWDLYDANYYEGSPSVDPVGAQSGSSRVSRGGSWGASPRLARLAYRRRYSPAYAVSLLGLRLSRTNP